MSRHKQLTDLQMDVMKVLWQRGEASVNQVHNDLHEKRQLAMTTVATLLSRLEKYGVLTHRTEGRQYIYQPLISRSDVRHSRVNTLLDHFFQGNPVDLVYHLLDESEIDDGELERIRALIEAKEEEGVSLE